MKDSLRALVAEAPRLVAWGRSQGLITDRAMSAGEYAYVQRKLATQTRAEAHHGSQRRKPPTPPTPMPRRCETCSGEGFVDRRCLHCNGSGEGMADGTRCPYCRGHGMVRADCPDCAHEREPSYWREDLEQDEHLRREDDP